MMDESLVDAVGRRLEWLEREMKPGERVVVKIVERCSCDAPRMFDTQKKCVLCGGSGYLVDAQTYTAEVEQ